MDEQTRREHYAYFQSRLADAQQLAGCLWRAKY